MKKLNIAEILRDCPKGMELDCAIYENVELDYIERSPESTYPIHCLMKTNGGYNALVFTHYGCNDRHPNAKCVIFPKGKTTWEGFQRPFKDGDILFVESAYNWIFIYKENKNNENLYKYAAMLGSSHSRIIHDNYPLCCKEDVSKIRLATEEEKQKLFDAIKANGYKWNPETKTLEKLIEPKFKVGDRIKSKNIRTNYLNDNHIFTITEISGGRYWSNRLAIEYIEKQDDWELVPNKFDITTLKPFESRVLVRTNNRKWVAAFYSHYDKDSLLHHCVVGGLWYEQCIPYKNNEYLLDTTNDCDDFYKTWE